MSDRRHRPGRHAGASPRVDARLGAVLAACCLGAAWPGPAAAQAQPVEGTGPALWEAGVGIAVLDWPDYRGSAHRRTLVLPLPWVVYRGRWLRADRDGARAVLLDGQRTEIDISLGGSAPAASHDNPRRAGMPDLPATLEIGPRLQHTLWQGSRRGHRLDLRVPVREVVSVERQPRLLGLVAEPHLNLDLPDEAGLGAGWNLGLQAGALWGSRRYHAHLYGVSTAQALPERPAWTARAGSGGWQALAAVSRRVGDLWFGAFVRHDRLAGAVFAGSPLVEQRHQWTAGLALAWVLARSDTRVDAPVSSP